jgi:hypothetical protein
MRQSLLKKKLGVDTTMAPPVLAIVVVDDEASRWLSFLRFTSNLLPFVSQKFAKAYDGAKKTFDWSLALIGLASTAIAFLTSHDYFFFIGLGAFFLIALFPVFVGVLFGALQVCTVIGNALLRGNRFGFGGETILDNWFNDIWVSETPLDVACEVYRTTSAEEGLRHSTFYRDAKVAGVIGNWLIRVLKEKTPLQ